MYFLKEESGNMWIRLSFVGLLISSMPFMGNTTRGMAGHLKNDEASEAKEVATLIEQLASDSIQDQDLATRRLIKLGEAARPQLEEALKRAEVNTCRRIDIILRGLDARSRQQALDREKSTYMAFLDGDSDARLPGWNDFQHCFAIHRADLREPFCRKFYAAMYRAEPELLEAYECNPAGVAEQLRKRFREFVFRQDVQQTVKSYANAGLRAPVDAQYTVAKLNPNSLLVYFFLACDPRIALTDEFSEEMDRQLFDDPASQQLLHSAVSPLVNSLVRANLDEEWKNRGNNRNQHEIVKNRSRKVYEPLLLNYLRRFPRDRQKVKQYLDLVHRRQSKEELPFILARLHEKPWDWERHPELLRIVGRLADRTYAKDLVKLLKDQTEKLEPSDGDPTIQVRDMALAAVLLLCEHNLEDYGLTPSDKAKRAQKRYQPRNKDRRKNQLAGLISRGYYYFETPRHRERALARWYAWTEDNLSSESTEDGPAN